MIQLGENQMTTRTVAVSPQGYARIAGVLYLIIIIVGALGQIFIRGRLIVPGDAVSTAGNLLASQSLWRIGIAGDLLMHIFDIPLMLTLYLLLKPVNNNLAVMAVLFNLIQTAVLVVNKLNLLLPLFLLGNAEYLKVLEPQQLQAFAYLPLKLHDYGFGIGLLFFACVCLVQGYLIIKSGFLPKLIGVLMALAGLSYLANSTTLLLAPAYAETVVPVLALALLGELSLSLWLIVKGVNVGEWKKRSADGVS
jgi:hypothetical protein